MYSGLIPGLSGLLIKQAVAGFSHVESVDVGLLFSANAQTWFSGILQMIATFQRPVSAVIDGRETRIPGFQHTRMLDFPEPFGKKRLRLVDYGERAVLAERLGLPTLAYWLGWETEALTTVMALLKKAGVLAYCLKNKSFGKLFSNVIRHNPNKPETTALSVETRGIRDDRPICKRMTLKAFSDYGATAIFNAALAEHLLQAPLPGVRFPFEMTDMYAMLARMNCEEIVIHTSDEWLPVQ